jgi:hypothetical protein
MKLPNDMVQLDILGPFYLSNSSQRNYIISCLDGGDHRSKLDGSNTITLDKPHKAIFGMSISFLFRASTGFETDIPPPLLRVTSAGADFFQE